MSSPPRSRGWLILLTILSILTGLSLVIGGGWVFVDLASQGSVEGIPMGLVASVVGGASAPS